MTEQGFDPGNIRVLVVDDELRLVDGLRMNLEVEGYRVLEAHDGLEALARLKADLPDLGALDVMMPELDGFQTLKRIRYLWSVPVIMLSVPDQPTDPYRRVAVAADD